MNNRGKKREIVFDVTTNTKGEVEVNVSIPYQDPRHTACMTIATPDVISYLKMNDIQHGDCVQNDWLDNTPGKPVLKGKWIFAKYTAPPRNTAATSLSKPAAKKRSTKSKKVTKKPQLEG